MKIEEARRRLEQAEEMGRMARRAGKKRATCPFKLGTSTDQYDAWLLGFDAEDKARKAGR